MIVLAIEHNPQEMALLREALARSTHSPFLVEHADRLAASLSCLAAREFDAILLDLDLPDSHGLNTLACVQAKAPELPIVILADSNAEPLAMLAVQNGAQDYVLKGAYDGGAIHRALRTAVERKRLMTDVQACAAQRKEMEEALHISQQRYASLLNAVSGIVWEADPATFRFTFVSAQAEHILGYPVQRWLNNPSFWSDCIHPEDREQAVAYRTKQTKLGRAHDFECRMLAADGRVVWIRNVLHVCVEAGRPVLSHGIMVDTTEQKRQNEKLTQLQCVVDHGMEGFALLNADGL